LLALEVARFPLSGHDHHTSNAPEKCHYNRNREDRANPIDSKLFV
jgi:hypothetical protein